MGNTQTLDDVNGKELTSGDINFDQRFERLKEVLGVEKDKGLSERLEITQQAVAGAKKRRVIPDSWVGKLIENKKSIDYVMYGKPAFGLETPYNIDMAKNQDEIEYILSKNLVKLALTNKDLALEDNQISVLVSLVKKKVLPDIERELTEIVKDIRKF